MKQDNDRYYYDLIRKNIRKYRTFSNMTQEKLAEKVNTSTGYINDIENLKKETKFSLEMAGLIIDNLGVPFSLLFDESKSITKPNENKIIHSSDYYYEVFRLNLKRYRKALGFTQKTLAKKANLSTNAISQIESPKIRMHFTIPTAGKISEVLNITLEELFNAQDLNINNEFKK